MHIEHIIQGVEHGVTIAIHYQPDAGKGWWCARLEFDDYGEFNWLGENLNKIKMWDAKKHEYGALNATRSCVEKGTLPPRSWCLDNEYVICCYAPTSKILDKWLKDFITY